MTDARMEYKNAGGLMATVQPVVLVGSVDADGIPQIAGVGGGSVDLAPYLTKSDAQGLYVPLSSLSSYATTEQLATVQSGIPSAVASALSGIEGSVTGDVSAAGGSITLALPDSGVQATLAYAGSGSASMTFSAVSGTVVPVDIRRNTIWGGSAVETFTLDGGTLTTAGTVADSTIYTASNDSSAYFIRANGNVYFLTVWASGNGARAFMGYHKMI